MLDGLLDRIVVRSPDSRRACSLRPFELVEKLCKLLKIVQLTDVAGKIVNPLGKFVPTRFVETLAGEFLRGLGQFFPPLVVREFGARNANDVQVDFNRPLRNS